MSKMNRRDYLIQMGAASAFLGMSNLLSPSVASAQPATKAAFLFTPTTPTAPSPTNLTVLFGGLMGFSNTTNGVVQVGFQKGTGKHKLDIKFFEKIGGGTNCYQLPSITSEDLAGVKTIDLLVRDQPANVNFFHKSGFDRNIAIDDPKDFGWVLDFEDSLLYPGGVNITPNKFSPVLKLSQGTLYTHQLTNSIFDLVEVPRNPVTYTINEVPRLVGAAIDIPAGKEAILQLNGKQVVQLPYIPSVQYEIQFMNDCYDGSGDPCKWTKPSDPDETVRNDFHMHYLTFKPKSSTKKYGVMLKTQKAGSTLLKCPPLPGAGTDEAPCMATGFGRQGGF